MKRKFAELPPLEGDDAVVDRESKRRAWSLSKPGASFSFPSAGSGASNGGGGGGGIMWPSSINSALLGGASGSSTPTRSPSISMSPAEGEHRSSAGTSGAGAGGPSIVSSPSMYAVSSLTDALQPLLTWLLPPAACITDAALFTPPPRIHVPTPMNTWCVTSRIGLAHASMPCLLVAVTDAATAFTLSLTMFDLPPHLLALFTGCVAPRGLQIEAVASLPTHTKLHGLQALVSYVLAAQAHALEQAQENYAALLGSLSYGARLPRAPAHAVRDGSETAGIAALWFHLGDHFSTFFRRPAYVAPALGDAYPSRDTATPSPPLGSAIDALAPIFASALGSMFVSSNGDADMHESPAHSHAVEALLSCPPLSATQAEALLSPKALQAFLMQWNVRADATAAVEAGAGGGGAAPGVHSSPRVKFLSATALSPTAPQS